MAERQQEQEKEREGEEGERWRKEPLAMSPGGRPLDYRGSEGWASRIITRSLMAGNSFCAFMVPFILFLDISLERNARLSHSKPSFFNKIDIVYETLPLVQLNWATTLLGFHCNMEWPFLWAFDHGEGIGFSKFLLLNFLWKDQKHGCGSWMAPQNFSLVIILKKPSEMLFCNTS